MRNRDLALSSVLSGIVFLLFCCEVGVGDLDDPNFIARNPYPADGERKVTTELELVLRWSPGDVGDIYGGDTWLFFNVYFGVNEVNVANAMVDSPEFKIYTDSTRYTIASARNKLEPDTEYFWRIDTRLTVMRPPRVIYRFKGEVWSFTTMPGPSRVITVDDDGAADFDNIQAAINASSDGDTVQVRPGRYTGEGNYDIDFLGKAITVTGTDPNDPNVVAETIVDCNSQGRGFCFRNNEGSDSVLAGLTITRGHADVGGGIFCEDSSPWIRNCRIAHNVTREHYGGGFGGGIYCDNSDALITGCTLIDNQARYAHAEIMIGGCGGGIYSQLGNPVITDCLFSGNYGMAAIHCFIGMPIIRGCTVRDDWDNWQGGIYLSYCEPVIEDCTIEDCEYIGIICDDVSDGIISGCTISDSRSGIESRASNLGISNCLILDNYEVGIHCIMSQCEIRNCSIISADLRRSSRRAVLFEGEGACKITNSILWGSGPVCDEGDSDCGDVTVNYSCIENWDGRFGGVGNIGDDPMFAEPGHWEDPCNTPEWSWDDVWVEGDYHLKSEGGRWETNEGRWVIDDVTSPCIDGGDPMSPVGLEPFANGGIINMGAYGGTAEASKSYFGEPPCETVMAGDVNGDCIVDFRDFQFMALHWLEDWALRVVE